ncbi:hypothetical protein HY227_02650 [Candidatus Wolfebacteria bacterium]|nr:hypothetical protein [Candidatus Wolfebacteria bacterium]
MSKNPFEKDINPDILKPKFTLTPEERKKAIEKLAWEIKSKNDKEKIPCTLKQAMDMAELEIAKKQEVTSANLQKHEEGKITNNVEKKLEDLLTPPIPPKQLPRIEKQLGQQL